MDSNKNNYGINNLENAKGSFRSLEREYATKHGAAATNAHVNAAGHPGNAAVGSMNRINLYHKELKDTIALLDTLDDETFREHKAAIQLTYRKAKDYLITGDASL